MEIELFQVSQKQKKAFSKIKSSLYSTRGITQERAMRVEAFLRLNAWATQLRRNVAAMASWWSLCVRSDRPGNRTPDLPSRLRCAQQLS